MTIINAVSGETSVKQGDFQSKKTPQTKQESVSLLWRLSEDLEAEKRKAKALEDIKKEEKPGVFMTAIGKGWLWGKEEKSKTIETPKENITSENPKPEELKHEEVKQEEIKPIEDKNQNEVPGSLLQLNEDLESAKKNIKKIKEAISQEETLTKNIEENSNIEKQEPFCETEQPKPQNIEQKSYNTPEVSKQEETPGFFMAVIGKGWLWGKEEKPKTVEAPKENITSENPKPKELKQEEVKQEEIKPVEDKNQNEGQNPNIDENIQNPSNNNLSEKAIDDVEKALIDILDVDEESSSEENDESCTMSETYDANYEKDLEIPENKSDTLNKTDDETYTVLETCDANYEEDLEVQENESDTSNANDNVYFQREELLDEIERTTDEEKRKNLINRLVNLNENKPVQEPQKPQEKVTPVNNQANVTNVTNVSTKIEPQKTVAPEQKEPQEIDIQQEQPEIEATSKISVDYKNLSDDELFDANDAAIESEDEETHKKILEEINRRFS